jgi:hypothetical protein
MVLNFRTRVFFDTNCPCRSFLYLYEYIRPAWCVCYSPHLSAISKSLFHFSIYTIFLSFPVHSSAGTLRVSNVGTFDRRWMYSLRTVGPLIIAIYPSVNLLRASWYVESCVIVGDKDIY